MYSKQKIFEYLTAPCRIESFDSVTSTNDLAKEFAESGEAEGLVIIASSQTNGKGSKGRKFYSPDSTGIYMSILLRPDLLPEKILHITTAAAVAVAEAIDDVLDKSAKIKWVNDVLCDGKKVCGILTEGTFDAGGNLKYAIVGIGANLYTPSGDFPAEISDIAGTVFESRKNSEDEYRLIAQIINRFFDCYARLGDASILQSYIERSNVIGRQIKIIDGAMQEQIATAVGIDDEFRLIVQDENGKRTALCSGDVSTRLA